MIRTRQYEPPLFYTTQEIAAASPQNWYARLEAALAGRWEQLAKPLRPAFVADWGRPTDPVVYLKCYLIGYFEGILYDTDLAERIADSISLRTFLGYTLTERTPDHSSLSHMRQQLGEYCAIEEVLTATVAACVETGLVGGKEAAVDGSLLPANAALSSLRSMKTGKSVREHLQEVRTRNRERQEGEKKEPETLSNAEFRSETDADAKIARKPGVRRGLYYRVTHVTDGQDQIILAAEGGDAEVGEAEAAKAPLTEASDNLKENELSLGAVSGDAQYDDADLHAHIESLGGKPVTHVQQEGSTKPKGFRKSDFTYLAQEDCYHCPAGKRLPPCKHHRDRIEYRPAPGVCEACEHRQACAGEAKARRRGVWRKEAEPSRERNGAYVVTEEGKAILKRRGQIVEAAFGHMKTYGGISRVTCRGRPKVHVKVVLAAVAWNLRKLVKALFPEPPARAPRARAGAGCAGAAGGVRVAGSLRGPAHAAVGVRCGLHGWCGLSWRRRILAAARSWLRPQPSMPQHAYPHV